MPTIDQKASTYERFAILHRVGELINSSLIVDDVLNAVMDSLLRVTGAERGFVMLVDRVSGGLSFKVARDREGSMLAAPDDAVSRNVVRKVVEAAEPVLITNALGDPEYARFASVAALQLKSVLAAPLKVKNQVIGVVYVENRLRSGLFTGDDVELLVAFSNQAAIAIDNARLYEDVRHQMQEIAAMKRYQDNIFRSVESGIVSLDVQGRITTFNQAAERIFGVSAADVVDRTYPDVFGPELSARLVGRAARVMGRREADVASLEVDCRLPGRDRAVLQVDLSPLRTEDGSVQGVVVVVEDLTEMRLLEEARQREESEKERVRSLFGRFVAPDVVEKILAEREGIPLGGELQQVTVLFGDIRGYTGMSELLPPAEIVRVLNRYLGAATTAILEQGGTLDKYIGDAVMAIFNAPLPQPDHALRAVRAAARMQEQVAQVEATPRGARAGYGVGLSTGEAIVGTIGTERLMNYTAIGDTINVASRLQALARPGEVLLTEATFLQVQEHVEAAFLSEIQVKGRQEPVRIYQLVRVLSW